MKPKPLRAVFVGTGSPYLCYGQTGTATPLDGAGVGWCWFSPDGEAGEVCRFPVERLELYCPAMGDDLNPSKGVNQ